MRATLVGALVGAVVWIAAGGASENDEGPGQRPVPRSSASPATARTITADALRSYARTTRTAIYWAGQRKATTLEFVAPRPGTTLLRYLPPGGRAGESRPHLLVATYRIADPLGAIRRSARRPGARTTQLPGGGLAVYDSPRATSVYFAYPGSAVQVQVFNPIPARALELLLSQQVVPVTAARR